MFYDKMPAHDATVEDFTFGDNDNITGELLLEFCEETYTRGDETFISDVNECHVVGVDLGANMILTRDWLVRFMTKSQVEAIESLHLEKRRELIG